MYNICDWFELHHAVWIWNWRYGDVFFNYHGHNLNLSSVNNCETGIINFHDLMRSKVNTVTANSWGGGGRWGTEHDNEKIYIFYAINYCNVTRLETGARGVWGHCTVHLKWSFFITLRIIYTILLRTITVKNGSTDQVHIIRQQKTYFNVHIKDITVKKAWTTRIPNFKRIKVT
jgi:hypothetical protein